MRRIAALLGALALLAGACGSDGNEGDEAAGEVTRTVEVTMRDIGFVPDEIAVEQGETVRFVFTNEGALVHDAFVGDAAAQEEHEMAAREADESGGGGHGHSGGEGITVDPGEKGELTHRFDGVGDLFIGCHEPGHYPTMRIEVTVS